MSPKSLSPELLAKYLDGPSSRPPSGIVPNLEHPPNRNGFALAIGTVCMIISSTALILRLYSRIRILKRLRIEDYLGLGAFICYIACIWAFFHFRQKAGFFVHQWNLPGRVLIDLGYNSVVITMAYSALMMCLKTAILLDWIRIFVLDRTHSTFYRFSVALIAVNVGIYFASIVSIGLSCRPLRRSWFFWIEGHCIDRKARDIINAAFNAALDLFLLFLPQRIIWRLNMSRHRKAGLSMVFAVGLLVNVCAIGRLYTTITLDYPDDITKPFDTTYQFSKTLMWAISEVAGTFLVFSVPALPKIFAEHRLPSRLTTSLRSLVRMPPRSESKHSKRTWPPTIGSLPTKPRRTARGYQLTEEDTQTQDSLTELPVLRDKYHGSAVVRQQKGIGVVKTLDVEHDAATSDIPDAHIVDLQHPWMSR